MAGKTDLETTWERQMELSRRAQQSAESGSAQALSDLENLLEHNARMRQKIKGMDSSELAAETQKMVDDTSFLTDDYARQIFKDALTQTPNLPYTWPRRPSPKLRVIRGGREDDG